MITLDATNQSMGRIASKIALILRGKTKATYEANELVKNSLFVGSKIIVGIIQLYQAHVVASDSYF